MMKRFVLAMGCTLAAAIPAPAQPIRFDVGRKLIAFEEAFEKQTDADARRRIVPPLQTAFRSFMSGRMSEAGRAMDEARWLLAGAEPPPAEVRWADAHALRLERPFLDAKTDTLTIKLVRLYDPRVDGVFAPGPLSIELRSADGQPVYRGRANAIQPDGAPARAELRDLPEGDHVLTASSGRIATTLTVSVAKDMAQRVARLRAAVEKLPEQGQTSNQRTLQMLAKIIGNLADGGWAETAYPCHRLLVEAETLAAAAPNAKVYDPAQSGQYWMTLSTPKSMVAPIRLYVPPQAKAGRPLPVVIAVHGAGGSENLFFDGYGHGEVVRQCAKRGWYCVAPRSGFLGVASPAGIVDELANTYPIDRSKVFLIGHSMGAGQVVSQARMAPTRYAGVVALGGGGRVAVSEALKKVPFFVGCGTEDFALRSAQSLARGLLDGGVERVEFRDYPDVEHIAVVQVALPEVFQWCDALLGK